MGQASSDRHHGSSHQTGKQQGRRHGGFF
jgi:hypothetical protein